MKWWNKLKHRVAHWGGWNHCEPVVLFDAESNLIHGVRCIGCGRVRIF